MLATVFLLTFSHSTGGYRVALKIFYKTAFVHRPRCCTKNRQQMNGETSNAKHATQNAEIAAGAITTNNSMKKHCASSMVIGVEEFVVEAVEGKTRFQRF